MKKVLLTLVSVLTTTLIFAQTRVVIAEEFTNASCPPCAAFNPKFHPVLEANAGKVISLKYQVNYPGFDPMNQQNNAEAKTRHDYYKVSGVPTPVIDGVTKTQTQAITQSTYDAAYNKAAPYEMSVEHSFNAKFDSISISIKVKNTSAADFTQANQLLHVAITEEVIAFPKAPGTNGEKVFYNVMRKMLPNAAGTAFPGTITAGETVTFTFNAPLPKYLYNLGEIAVVAFIQNNTTKVINQAGATSPLPLVGNFVDVAADNKSALPSAPCGTEITPKVEFKNTSSLDVTSLDAYYTLNGKKSTVIPWTGKIGKDETATITFPKVDATAGKTNTLSVGVENINAGAVIDLSSLNNVSSDNIIRVMPSAAKAKKMNLLFETALGSFPTTAATIVSTSADAASFIYVVDQGVTTPANAPDQLGGFGLSKSSLRYRFAALTNIGEELGVAFNKLNLTDSRETKLKFDYAYAQYEEQGTAFSEKFEVLVSKDCGATYKSYFSKEGEDLVTAQVSPIAKVFYPLSDDWKTEEIDIKEFDGAPEVIVIFKGTSGYGNNIYLDNVNVDGKTVGIQENILENATMEVTPNPASEFTYVKMNLNEAMNASVKIFDITGKQVAILADNQAFGAGEYQLRWDISQAQGVYIVKIETAAGQMTKRLTIVK
jgi:hypothetical protein